MYPNRLLTRATATFWPVDTLTRFWDGNEVWLIVAGAATFAAFPSWYASMFSALYLAMMLRAVIAHHPGRVFCVPGQVRRYPMALDLGLDADGGSALIPLLLGIAIGDLLHGLPINKDGNYAGTFWDLFTPYGVWVGLTLLALTVTPVSCTSA